MSLTWSLNSYNPCSLCKSNNRQFMTMIKNTTRIFGDDALFLCFEYWSYHNLWTFFGRATEQPDAVERVLLCTAHFVCSNWVVRKAPQRTFKSRKIGMKDDLNFVHFTLITASPLPDGIQIITDLVEELDEGWGVLHALNRSLASMSCIHGTPSTRWETCHIVN